MIRLWLLFLAALMGFGHSVAYADNAVSVKDAYALATAPTQRNGAVFMVIENTGSEDKVLGANSSIAERIELHTHTMDDGIMMMREVGHYDVPENGQATLEPTGHHIMLMGLTHPLKAGEHFPLVLDLENAGPINVDVMVVKPGDAP